MRHWRSRRRHPLRAWPQSATPGPSDRYINRIRIRRIGATGKVQCSIKRNDQKVVLEEFDKWSDAEAWAKQTRGFTIIGTPNY